MSPVIETIEKPFGKERERQSTPSRIENLLDAIEDGRELEPDEVLPKERVLGVFECLREMHRAFNDETIGGDPRQLLRMLRETTRVCKEVGNMKRAYWMAASISQLALMRLVPGHHEWPQGYLPPDELPPERRMPPEYYDMIGMIAAAEQETALDNPKLYDPRVGTVMEAAKMLGDTVYGGMVQREFLERIMEADPEREVLFDAYMAVPSKTLLPASRTLGEAYGAAKAKMVRLEADKPTEDFDMPNAISYVDGAQGVLGMALTLRKRFPDVSAKECIAFLYENAATVGALAQRYNMASPTYRNVPAQESHDATFLLDGVNSGAYCVERDGNGKLTLAIVGVPHREEEFPDDIFSKNKKVRAKQESKLRRRRMYGGGCPARYEVRLPKGRMRDSAEELSERIQKEYEVDPQIITADGMLNPAALMVARVIEAGVCGGTPECNLWTRGLEEFGVPAAAQEVERSYVVM